MLLVDELVQHVLPVAESKPPKKPMKTIEPPADQALDFFHWRPSIG